MNRIPKLSLTRFILFSVVGFAFFISSCKKDTHTPEPDSTNSTVNEWVAENMRIYYYWNQSIPSNRRLDFTKAPTDFFETLLDPADRFSWIQKADELDDYLSGVSTSTGINFVLFRYSTRNIFASIRYVIPGSPAEALGVKRGMIFTSVNGTLLTMDNYNQVLDPYFNGEGFQITLANLENNTITQTDKKISLTAARIDEPSVHFKEILTTSSGKKVGYIFYNHFLDAKADELFTVFNELKAAGVSDLILDLRYNLGGGIAVSGVLSALIKQSYAKDQIFVKYNYNSILNAEIPLDERNTSFENLFFSVSKLKDTTAAIKEIDNKIKTANLNLPRVYILATDNSASASELVLHNLAPYMQVIHIGDTTIGKNEGSITIKDEREPRIIDWAIQPIIVKLADKNGDGDYDKGLIPDYLIDENDFLPLSPLGSKEDPLIAKALGLIDPALSRSTLSRTMLPSRSDAFSAINRFNKEHYKPLPVMMDGAIDKKVLERVQKINR